MPHSLALPPTVSPEQDTNTHAKPNYMNNAPPATLQGFSEIAAAFDGATSATLARNLDLQLGDVVAEPLLTALLRFLVVFDALGSAVVAKIVRQDFRSKTEAVRSALTREKVSTVRQLVAAERTRPPRPFLDANATEALLWTKRVLSFVDALVANLLQNPDTQLRDATTAAYRHTMGVKHNVVMRSLFENALTLLPDTTTFLCNLYKCESPYDDKVAANFSQAMRDFRIAVKPHIAAFDAVFPEE